MCDALLRHVSSNSRIVLPHVRVRSERLLEGIGELEFSAQEYRLRVLAEVDSGEAVPELLDFLYSAERATLLRLGLKAIETVAEAPAHLAVVLENGDSRLRREVLRRPRYTNAEFLEDVTPRVVEGFKAWRLRAAAPVTVRLEMNTLGSMLRWAGEIGYRTGDISRVKRPKKVKKSVRLPESWLASTEIKAIRGQNQPMIWRMN